MTKFDELNLSDPLLRAIEAMGFERPSEIQAKAIPVLLTGKDIIGQAQTGTGKTAAFAIPSIEKIDPENSATQILVLCPTRELVVQVAGEYTKLTKFLKNISIVPIYGGQGIDIQFRALKKGAQIVVGTPGRIMDHMRRGTLELDQITCVVLDEADQMLDMGFREDMEIILQDTPEERQTVMFSATLPPDLVRLMERFLKHPKRISAAPAEKQSAQINQFYYNIKESSKQEALKRLLTYHKVNSALIFCNTKMKVDDLTRSLSSDNFSTAALHGDLDQNKRDRVMQAFRKGDINLLIATDVAARGIDVNDLEAVINYDLPRFDQDYVHRIGRTGRAGKTGLAISFVVGKEIEHLRRIARKNNMNIEAADVPSIGELEKASLEMIQQQLNDSKLNAAESVKYASYLKRLKIEDLDQEQISALLLKCLVDQATKTLEKTIDFSPHEHSSSRDGRRSRGSSGGGRRDDRRSGGGGRSYSSGGSGGRSRDRDGRSGGGGGRSSSAPYRTGKPSAPSRPKSSGGKSSSSKSSGRKGKR